MDAQAPSCGLISHSELCIGLELAQQSTTIQIRIPKSSIFTPALHAIRTFIEVTTGEKDEESLKKRHFAARSDLYFYDSQNEAHSLLWRLLDNNSTLELRVLDIGQSEAHAAQASVSIQLALPSPIIAGCVGFAGQMHDDTLHIFVITQLGELYTFQLKQEVFNDANGSDQALSEWCQTYKPSSFTISQAHAITHCSRDELIVSLRDGRLLRLTRQDGADGSAWQEFAYSEGSWGMSLRGLVGWQGSRAVKHAKDMLDPSTALEATPSPDGAHILTVTLDHRLRFWNLISGKITFSRDLLGVEREAHEPTPLIDARTNKLLVIDPHILPVRDGDQFYVFTYSPEQAGCFKVWAVRDGEYGNEGVRDMFETPLQAPDPDDGALWTVADWSVSCKIGAQALDFWILLKLNTRSKLLHKTFETLESLGREWATPWQATHMTPALSDPSKFPGFEKSTSASTDQFSQWIDFVFITHHISESLLGTALHMYANLRGMGCKVDSSISTKEAIIKCISQYSRSKVASETSQDQSSSEWSTFWNIVIDLDQRQRESLAIALDPEQGSPWLVATNSISLVLDCTELETMVYNEAGALFTEPRSIAQSIEDEHAREDSHVCANLLAAAADFRAGFSAILHTRSDEAVALDLWRECNTSPQERLESMFERCGFDDEIQDRQYHDIARTSKSLASSDAFRTEVFLQILATLPTSIGQASDSVLTGFGSEVLVKGARDMAILHIRVLTDLLLYCVFVEVDEDLKQDISAGFDGGSVFEKISEQLRLLQMIKWLATHRTSMSTPNFSVLHGMFVRDIRPQEMVNQSLAQAVRGSIYDLFKWVTGGNESIAIDQVIDKTQAQQVKAGELGLAADFRLFQPTTSLAVYTEARRHLASCSFYNAALLFQKASFEMAGPMPPASFYTTATAELISQFQSSSMSSGLCNYYSHVVDLYTEASVKWPEPNRPYRQIEHFAKLALQFCKHPTAAVNGPESNQRKSLLLTLSKACCALGEWESALSAITRLDDTALRRRRLQDISQEIIMAGDIRCLLDFPFQVQDKRNLNSFLEEQAQLELIKPGSTRWTQNPVKILYAWKIAQGDFRGAAAAVVANIQHRNGKPRGKDRNIGIRPKKATIDEEFNEYLAGINALALLQTPPDLNSGEHEDDEESWVFVHRSDDAGNEGLHNRMVLRLSDVRRQYQDEIDMREAWAKGRFALTADQT